MKKFCILFFSLFIIALTVFSVLPSADPLPTAAEYLRIHIRANSDSAEDQAVKYVVRDRLIEAISPWVADCPTKECALLQATSRSEEISSVCDAVLRENGFYYGAKAQVKKEIFPTRIYGEYTLEAGEYDALIVELGDGAGANWWCCIYPPLCFTGTEKVIYRSKIAEIIERFFAT